MAEYKELNKKRYILLLSGFFAALLLALYTGLITGTADISAGDLWAWVTGNNPDTIKTSILTEIRLPRVLLAAVIGSGLSVAGAVFQAILMNPLAEPYILGISSGGTFGAVLSFLLGLSFVFTQVFSFTGALLVVFFVFFLSKRFGEVEPNILLLSGVMLGAFFSAAILLMMTLLQKSLRTAVLWMIGNLSLAEPGTLYYIVPMVIIPAIYLIFNSYKYNLLTLGTENARSLGINTSFLKNSSYIAASFMVGGIVSVSGIIGFVGLIIPHICRMLLGPDNRIVIPASLLLGAVYLVLADTLARTVISPAELPVGAVTSIIGAPVFIYLLRKRFTIFA